MQVTANEALRTRRVGAPGSQLRLPLIEQLLFGRLRAKHFPLRHTHTHIRSLNECGNIDDIEQEKDQVPTNRHPEHDGLPLHVRVRVVEE